jgi:hypothetical protein
MDVEARLGKLITSPTAYIWGDIGLVAFVDLQPPTLVGGEASGTKVQRVGSPGTAYAVQRLFRYNLLAAGQVDPDSFTVGVFYGLDAANLLAQAQGNPVLAQMIGQSIDYL